MNSKLPKKLLEQVQSIAKDLADYEHLRYLSDPVKLSHKKETSRILNLSASTLENRQQDLSKLIRSEKTPAEIQRAVVEQILEATNHIVKDMNKTSHELQGREMKALKKSDPQYQQKKLLIQNGIVAMPQEGRYDLANSINMLMAKSATARELIQRKESDTIKPLPGKDYFIQLSKELQQQSREQRLLQGGAQSSVKAQLSHERTLAVVEYRVQFGIAGKKDYQELMMQARQQIQHNQARGGKENSLDTLGIEQKNQRILQTVDGIKRSVYREQVMKENKKLGDAVTSYERSVQRDAMKQAVTAKPTWDLVRKVIQQPTPQQKRPITEISSIIKAYNRERIYRPHKVELKNGNFVGTPNQQQYQYEEQHAYRLNVNAQLERFEKNYKVDQKLPKPEYRSSERNQVKYRITILAKKVQQEMRGDFLRSNASSIQAIEKHIDALGTNKNLKTVSKNNTKARAQKIEFKQRSRKQRPRM